MNSTIELELLAGGLLGVDKGVAIGVEVPLDKFPSEGASLGVDPFPWNRGR